MSQSKTRRRKGHGELIPPLSVSERILELLQIQANTFPPKELEQGEIERWVQDLSQFPIAAIEWAFENWRRSGRFFPVPGDILDQCIAWAPSTGTTLCDAECKKRHGKGYGSNDIVWLLAKYNQKRAQLPNRPLTDGEVEALMDDLDKHRGHAPLWRAA